jgi:hypothetical protein
MSAMIHKGPLTALFTAQTLTGSLVASTAECDVSLASYCDLTVDYTQGTGGTSPKLELTVEQKHEGSSTWRQVATLDAGTVAAGAVPLALTTPTYTLAASASLVFSVPCFGAGKLRVKVRETGSPSPFGSVTVAAIPSRVGG